MSTIIIKILDIVKPKISIFNVYSNILSKILYTPLKGTFDQSEDRGCLKNFFLQRTGLLKMLDVECSVRGCPETYVQKVKVQHKDNTRSENFD